MKKINNRYRNNNSSNTIYSLNYKFDSNSIAGKVSGTALDLIKRYNDLAKDAHSNNDYVTAEIFRQYAEHYRKIVTEINERRTSFREQADNAAGIDNATLSENTENINANTIAEESAPQENVTTAESAENTAKEPVAAEVKPAGRRKSFHVIEISKSKPEEKTPEIAAEEASIKPKRVYRRKAAVEA